ncbi:MAG: hypothetical protein FJW37_14150, partial [Acidobacteria bacterium]|nr:hypothetical protein [Acidobacteriota bacterium]
MRYFLTRRRPAAGRVLLVESGSRRLLDGLLPQASRIWGERAEMHLLTCFGGRPESLPPGSVVYWLGDYAGPGGRKRLY